MKNNMGNLSAKISEVANLLKDEIIKGNFQFSTGYLDGSVASILVNQEYNFSLSSLSSGILSDLICLEGKELNDFMKLVKLKQREFLSSNDEEVINSSEFVPEISIKIKEIGIAFKTEILNGNFTVSDVSQCFETSNVYASQIKVLKEYTFSLYSNSGFFSSEFSNDLMFNDLEIEQFKELLKSKERVYKDYLILSAEEKIEILKREIIALA